MRWANSPLARRLSIFIALVLIGLITPGALDLYAQEQGGRLLIRVLQSRQDVHAPFDDLVSAVYAPIADEETESQLQLAIAQLQRGTGDHPVNVYSHLLLGRAYLLSSNLQAGIETLRTYTRLRPLNDLGHWALAQAYEAAWRHWGGSVSAGLVVESSQATDSGAKQYEMVHAAAEAMVSEWRAARLTAESFIDRGEAVRRAHRDEEALVWYERAVMLAPELAEPWYYIGLAYEGMEAWEKALQSYSQGLALHPRSGMSSFYFRLGNVKHRYLDDQQDAWTDYATALTTNDFYQEWEKAQTHYKRGELLYQWGQGEEAIEEFRRALDISPRHYWAHIQLGIAYWKTRGDARAAEAMFEEATRIYPNNKAAYRFLGDIHTAQGELIQARDAYLTVLSLDPSDKQVRDIVERIANLDNADPQLNLP